MGAQERPRSRGGGERSALLRLLPPVEANAARPIALAAGEELEGMGVEGVEELGDLPRALEAAGYANTGELDGRAPSPCAAVLWTCFPAT